jgi:hypothetical protein
LQHGSKKVDKKIAKGAKILAKKIAKELVINGNALLSISSQDVAKTKDKTNVAAPAPAKNKTAAKKEAEVNKAKALNGVAEATEIKS